MEITFKMDGPILEESIPLYLLTPALENVQSLIDKTYLTLSGKKRLSKNERKHFQLRTNGINKGSANSVLELFMIGTQIALPLYYNMGADGIWKYTQSAFEFLKIVLKARNNGEIPRYEFRGNENSNLDVHIGDNTYNFNAPVYFIGKSSLSNYQKLSEPIDEGVDFLELKSSGKPDIVLASEEKKLFSIKSIISEQPEQLTCEIFDFNKFDNIGKLYVFEGQSIPEGNYRFSVIGNQDTAAFIEAMLKRNVTITCLLEISDDPFEMEKVVALQIINISQ